jgi:hypothetical protein
MMDDEQKERVLAHEPDVPYDGGREAPLDPDKLRANGFIPSLRFVGKGDSLESVAREVNDPALGAFDWRRLARYNWGTSDPREINWYLLRDCHAVLAPTKSGRNVMFVDDAITHMPGASLWVPHRVESAVQRPVPVARVDVDGHVNDAPTVVDTLVCPILDVAAGTCRVAKLGEKAMECWPPSVPLRDVKAYDLGKFNSEKAREALERARKRKDGKAAPPGGVALHSSKTFTLSLNTWIIEHTPPVGTAVMTLTEFHVDLQAHQAVDVRDDEPSKRATGTSSGAGPAVAPPMGRLAHSIGMLIDAGRLQRVVIRGYEDRSAPRHTLDRARTGRRRAADVLERLQQHHLLPLYDEALPGEFPGLIPVALVGAGAGDAPAGEASPSHDVVLVDLQTGEVSAAQEYELQDVSHWLFAEVTDLENPENDCSMLYAHGHGLCKTPLDVARARESAAAYGRILLSLGPKNAEKGREILEGVHRWAMVNEDKWSRYEGTLTQRVREEVDDEELFGEWPSGLSLFKPVGAESPANHRRRGRFSQVTASFDSLREITDAWWKAERYVQLAHRIPV